MNSKDLSENAKLLAVIDKILAENPGTNFEQVFPQHLNIYLKYLDAAKKKQNCFPDRETYQAFSCAKLFFDKLKFAVFQKEGETQIIEDEDHVLPLLEAFHRTGDEIEMMKNRVLEHINKGDILHLKVEGENDEHYNLQILNKYGDKGRIIDCKLVAVLLKCNPLVKKINPPLQIDDLIRATAFGNIKQEKGQYKTLIVSLNSSIITDNKLKDDIRLGRVFKKDIPHYPEDVSSYSSFGEYLKADSKFQSPEDIVKQICAFGCDPLQIGPLYETRYKRKIADDCDTMLSEETQKLSIHSNKTRKADDLLKNGDLHNALSLIEEAIQSYPNNDLAYTIRGKIYLALAGGRPSRNVKKAFLDFETALKMNEFNEEANELRNSIFMESIDRFNERNMPEKAKKLKDYLGEQSLSVRTKEFLKTIKERKVTHGKASSTVEAGASSFHPVPVGVVKEEPMDV